MISWIKELNTMFDYFLFKNQNVGKSKKRGGNYNSKTSSGSSN